MCVACLVVVGRTEEPVEPTTSWHSIFAYGQAADRLESLEKG